MADRYGDARLTRREALVLGGLAAVGATSVPGALAASPAYEGQLNIYNWAQYQDPSNLKAFSKKSGVRYTDVLHLERAAPDPAADHEGPEGLRHHRPRRRPRPHREGRQWTRPARAARPRLIPNLKYLGAAVAQAHLRPRQQVLRAQGRRRHGLHARTDRVKANLSSWKDFFDFLPHAKGLHVNFIESPAEVIGVALNALGYSMNTKSDKELSAARKLLLSVKPVRDDDQRGLSRRLLGRQDRPRASRIPATACAPGGRKAKHDIKVVLPAGRSELWIDNWAISAYAPHPDAPRMPGSTTCCSRR